MSQLIIRTLLEKRLNALGGLPIAFENVPYRPVTGQAYQQAGMLPAPTEQPTAGSAATGGQITRERGLMQVTLCYPENAGSGAALARAEAIKAHFPRGLTLSEGAVRVVVEATPSVARGFNDGGFFRVPVSVNYWADVQS